MKAKHTAAELLLGCKALTDTLATPLGGNNRQECWIYGRGLIHKARGRTSNRTCYEGIRKYAVELVMTRYADFGPTLAIEALAEGTRPLELSGTNSCFTR